jgi:hypothetical protein
LKKNVKSFLLLVFETLSLVFLLFLYEKLTAGLFIEVTRS